jgi:tetratricopeptide (TPR) repeat protein
MGHHLTNIVLHALNTFLVVLLCIKLLDIGKERSAALRGASTALDERGMRIAAGVTGLLFGLHPVHVESVAWVSERKDLLCGLFFLLSISAYTNHVCALGNEPIEQNKAATRFFKKASLASLAFFVLSLLSKPMAVSLPVVLLILDWYPFRRIRSLKAFVAACLEKLPFIACSLAVSAVTLFSQEVLGAVAPREEARLAVRLIVAAKALIGYLWKMAIPLHLMPLYPYPKNVSFLSFGYLSAIILLSGITAASLVLRKKRKIVLTIWGCYLITLLPVIGIVRVGNQFMADRYTYLPSIGPFLLIGLGAAWVWAKADSEKHWGRAVKGFSAAVAISLVFSLSYATLKQIALWRNSIDLWSYVIAMDPRGIPIAYTNRGVAFKEAGQLDRAVEDYNTAIALRPTEYIAYNNRGVVFYEAGQFDRAIQDFNASILLKPSNADTYTNRGRVFKDMGQRERAIEDFDKAITLNPVNHMAYYNRGVVFGEMGQRDRSLKDFNRAITLNPSSADAYTSRGLVFEEMGQLERAMKDLDEAITLNPSSVDAYLNRGVAFEHMRQFDRALVDYGRAIALNPSDALAYSNRGIVFNKLGRVNEAIEDYTRALFLNPEFVKAYLDRGDLRQKTGSIKLALRDYQKACTLGSEEGCEAVRTHGKR